MKKHTYIKFFIKNRELLRLLTISAGTALIDLIFKESIDEEPSENFPRELPRSEGNVTIYKKRNDGFAMGFMKEYPELVKITPVCITALLIGRLQMLSEIRGRRLEKIGLALCVGGSLSNLTDRFRKGYVVDYIGINKGALKKIVVNIGDIAIFAGAVIMALGSIFGASGKALRK